MRQQQGSPLGLDVMGSWHGYSQIRPIAVPLVTQEVQPSAMLPINVQQHHCAGTCVRGMVTNKDNFNKTRQDIYPVGGILL